jgi:SAM-dependent methyltransferase
MISNQRVFPSLPALLERDDHDTHARGLFILALKSWVTRDLTDQVRADFSERLEPRIRSRLGRALSQTSKEDRHVAREEMQQDRLFRFWSKLSYEAQGMKWRFMDRLLDEHRDELQSAADGYLRNPEPLGSLQLQPGMKLPGNIANAEIHRQPRGFCHEEGDSDISAGVLYNLGALFGPSVAAGRSPLRRGRTAADVLCEDLAQRFGPFRPEKVLELGCGTGRNTPSYAMQYPAAEVHAVDCAPGLLRWAFAFAESRGVAVHFHQMDITALEFPTESFDLVTSHIVGHETTSRNLASMIGEAWRVLKPGGVMYHMDVPTQSTRLGICDQVLNDFQVRHNGEPFWMGWADANMPALMCAAGIPAACQFEAYIAPPERGSPWYCYGARKPSRAEERT